MPCLEAIWNGTVIARTFGRPSLFSALLLPLNAALYCPGYMLLRTAYAYPTFEVLPPYVVDSTHATGACVSLQDQPLDGTFDGTMDASFGGTSGGTFDRTCKTTHSTSLLASPSTEYPHRCRCKAREILHRCPHRSRILLPSFAPFGRSAGTSAISTSCMYKTAALVYYISYDGCHS